MDNWDKGFGSRLEWLYKHGYIVRPETDKVSQNAFYSMKRPQANPTLAKILALRETNHLLNLHWLLTGEGNPFNIDPNYQPVSEIDKKIYAYVFGEGNTTAVNDSQAIYYSRNDKRELQLLIQEIDYLQKLLEQKDKMIDLLQNQYSGCLRQCG
jgi:hypothetical protein